MKKKKGKEKHLVNSRRATFLLLFIISIQRQLTKQHTIFSQKGTNTIFIFSVWYQYWDVPKWLRCQTVVETCKHCKEGSRGRESGTCPLLPSSA